MGQPVQASIDKTDRQIVLIVVCCLAISPASSRCAMRTLEEDDIASPVSLINLLAKTAYNRRAANVRKALIGREAPGICTERWLVPPREALVQPPGRTSVLYWWSIHCGISMAEIRRGEVAKLAADVERKGWRFLAVHSFVEMEEVAAIRQVLEEQKINFPVALDSRGEDTFYWGGRTFAAYGVDVIPQCVIIGVDGRVLSYKSLNLVDPNQLIAGAHMMKADSAAESNPLTLTPPSWRVDNAEPGSSVSERFLLYRPDSPGLAMRALESSEPNVRVIHNVYSGRGQTVFELQASATAPMWGRTIQGMIRAELEHAGKRYTREIPLTVTSRPLLACPPDIYFGLAGRDEEVLKRIIVRSNVPREKLRLTMVDAPKAVRVQLRDSLGVGCGGIPVEVCFRGSTAGTHRGTITLRGLYDRGQFSQVVELKYVAIVRD